MDLVKAGNEAFKNGELKGIENLVTCDENECWFYQRAFTNLEYRFLANELDKLDQLKNSGFVPKVISINPLQRMLITEYLGESEPVTDEVAFRRNCALLLIELKKAGIRHGDISTKNIIVKNNKPMLVDFKQSKFDHEEGEDKRPEGDAYNLWKAALELSPDTSRHIRKWQAIRPFLGDRDIVLDYGCAEGDYCLFARSEKPDSVIFGYDIDESAISRAKSKWGKYDCDFTTKNPPAMPFHTTFFMSVYAHIAHNTGLEKANETLGFLCQNSMQLFFETQLIGDGPGIHKSDDDVYKMLKQYGKVERLVIIPVHGREPLARSVWRIT